MNAFQAFTSSVRAHSPRLAIVLGSGIGSVPHRFNEIARVPFADVPGLVAPSIHGHSGKLSLGICAAQPLLVFRGRLHFYEGHARERVASPIHVMAEWGVKAVLLTNAAGGIHENLNPGDLMVLKGHLFLQKPNSWKQPLRIAAYSARLIEQLQTNEREHGRELQSGIYAAVTGPCYETPAEIRALRTMGADAVGMSTAFEAETAALLGLEVAAISCITNKAAGLTSETLNHAEVLANARKPAERSSEIIEAMLTNCSNN